MKDKIYIISISIVAVLLIVFYVKWSNEKGERIRVEGNQNSFISLDNSFNLKTKELKDYIDKRMPELLDKMSDSLAMKIRPSNVTRLNTTTNTYMDTNIIEVPLVMMDNMYPFSYKDSCWGVKGFFDINQEKITFTERNASSSVVRVDYVKRERVKWLFGLRVGKKKASVYVESNCGKAESVIIDVVK